MSHFLDHFNLVFILEDLEKFLLWDVVFAFKVFLLIVLAECFGVTLMHQGASF